MVFHPECTVTGARSYLRVVATGVGAAGINSAASAVTVEIDAVTVGPSGQGKGRRTSMKMVNKPLLYQPSGQIFRIFLQGKFIRQVHTDQISGLYLNRQTAAGGGTVVTEFRRIFCPGGGIVEIGVLPREV